MPTMELSIEEKAEQYDNGYSAIGLRRRTKERFEAFAKELKESGRVDTYSDALEMILDFWEALNSENDDIE